MSDDETLVLDSSCWIAWIDTTDRRWEILDEYVEQRDADLVVPSIVLFEVDRWLRRNGIDAPTRLSITKRLRREREAPITHQIALRAGTLARAHGLATADALIAGTASVIGSDLCSFDPDFAAVPGATVLS